ncbi:MAG TPA: response regulator transcription factor [Gammaproteobacteria bacterium]|nr:response regulator transcription factor [Gammaproteobacteria bacterium]
MRVLLVEDEVALRKPLAVALRAKGFVVDEAVDGEEGLYFSLEYPLDLAIIDLGLPKRDGISVITELRSAGKTYPVLILTARNRWQEKVAGLEAGADDYLVKPFHGEELLARMRALLRRSAGSPTSQLHNGPMVIDTATETVYIHNQLVDLTAFEYRMLSYLAMKLGQPVSKQELTEHLYAEDADRDSNVLEVFVRRLRLKLDPEKTLLPIETVRGRGYRLRELDVT